MVDNLAGSEPEMAYVSTVLKLKNGAVAGI
jgi:hypothetical protein